MTGDSEATSPDCRSVLLLESQPELRAQFSAGRVVRDREAVGFGGAQVQPRAGAGPKRKPSASSTRRRKAERAEQQAAHSLDAAAIDQSRTP